jgi:hypothetical protein
MVAKEKAKELVNKFLQIYDGRVPQAKQSALICVDVILNDVGAKDWELDTGTNTNYWQEVKQEINKI